MFNPLRALLNHGYKQCRIDLIRKAHDTYMSTSVSVVEADFLDKYAFFDFSKEEFKEIHSWFSEI